MTRKCLFIKESVRPWLFKGGQDKRQEYLLTIFAPFALTSLLGLSQPVASREAAEAVRLKDLVAVSMLGAVADALMHIGRRLFRRV